MREWDNFEKLSEILLEPGEENYIFIVNHQNKELAGRYFIVKRQDETTVRFTLPDWLEGKASQDDCCIDFTNKSEWHIVDGTATRVVNGKALYSIEYYFDRENSGMDIRLFCDVYPFVEPDIDFDTFMNGRKHEEVLNRIPQIPVYSYNEKTGKSTFYRYGYVTS